VGQVVGLKSPKKVPIPGERDNAGEMLQVACPDLTVTSSGRAAAYDLDRSRHSDHPQPPALRRLRSSAQQSALESWAVRHRRSAERRLPEDRRTGSGLAAAAPSGVVTRTKLARAKIGSPNSGSGCGSSSPRLESFLSEDAKRAAGFEMALDVEDPMESG
jgi:hypothetical protein